MTLLQAAIIFALGLMDKTNHGWPYDEKVVIEVADAIVAVTQDLSEVETMINISRYESAGYRSDVIHCRKKGDDGQAHGIFQVHPWTEQEAKKLCGSYVEQATIALARVRESGRQCKSMGRQGADLLAAYTHGTCVKNNSAARLYWGDGKALRKMIENEQVVQASSKLSLRSE